MLCGLTGDNDPVDVVEIGERQLETGGVYAVKPLAVLAMIDDGELDWKVRRLAFIFKSATLIFAAATRLHPHPVLHITPCTQAGDPAVAVQVIAIRADDPRAAGMEDVEDVERCALCPSLLFLSLMQHAAFEDA